MGFEVKFQAIGLEKIQKRLSELTANQNKELRLGLAESVLMVHGTAVKSIQSHQSKGIKYGKHTASTEGNPPNTDTGRLVRGIDWEVNTENMTALVGTNVKYGPWLEFGTLKMGPRPWLLPAYIKNLKSIKDIMIKAAKEALK